MERKGDARVGWPAEWDDKRDDAIETGCSSEDFEENDPVEVWFRGFWWACTIYRRSLASNTLTVRWNHNMRRTSGYRPGLVRPNR